MPAANSPAPNKTASMGIARLRRFGAGTAAVLGCVLCGAVSCSPSAFQQFLDSETNVTSGEQATGPLRGQFCGKVKGIERRSDGTEFEGEWIVFVQFADDGTLKSVSELFESGETYQIDAIGVPISREESGSDFYTLRQLTPLSARQADGFAEVVTGYQRWDRFLDDDGPHSYFESHGEVTLRFTSAGDDLHCAVERVWHNELPLYDSTWTAAGYLERDGKPRPMYAGSYRFPLNNTQSPDPLRFRFNEFGRLMELGYCDFDHDRNFHGGTWPRNSILDVRYRTDSVFIATEIRRPIVFNPGDRYTPPRWETGQEVREHELWPVNEGISVTTAITSRIYHGPAPDPDDLDENVESLTTFEFDSQLYIHPDFLDPQAAGTWWGGVSGELYTRQANGTYVVTSLARTVFVTFDETGFPTTIAIGDRTFSLPCSLHALECAAEGIRIDHRGGFTAPEPEGRELIYLTWPRDGVIQCDIVKDNAFSGGPQARWAASGVLSRF